VQNAAKQYIGAYSVNKLEPYLCSPIWYPDLCLKRCFFAQEVKI